MAYISGWKIAERLAQRDTVCGQWYKVQLAADDYWHCLAVDVGAVIANHIH